MFTAIDRATMLDKPLRVTIASLFVVLMRMYLILCGDAFKPGQGVPAAVIAAGKIESGFISMQDKVTLSPGDHLCTVKTLHKNNSIQSNFSNYPF